MKLTRLRLQGFKSFVDQSDVLIEPGLTGIVGPNGCGKSNLVEGLRWVMGESSHKTLRAAEMDDVIFAGSRQRPARNVAEVGVVLDNSARSAPPPWTSEEKLEIARRIERGRGSSYRINGREVRARDVQMLFADASTGARSPSLVRQGQVGEIINARPEARRRVLEEAAGISGLHVRRHEAELRLRSAEQNLLRVEDVLARLTVQIEGLKRQARHAGKYRQVAAEIRRLEAVVLERAYAVAFAEANTARDDLVAAERAVAQAMTAQANAARDEAVAGRALEPLRQAAAAASAKRARLRQAGLDLDREEEDAARRLADIERQLGELGADQARAETVLDDAAASLARLAEEEAALAPGDERAVSEASERLRRAESERTQAESHLAEAAQALAESRATRDAIVRAEREANERCARLEVEIAAVELSLKAAEADPALAVATGMDKDVAGAEAGLAETEIRQRSAEEALQGARDAEANAASALKEAEAELRRHEVERDSLARLVAASTAAKGPPLMDGLTVAAGWEVALAAALGDELEGSLDHWRFLPTLAEEQSWPVGVEPLIAHVQGPPELQRRLKFVGVVAAEDGARLQSELAPGQLLVSHKGDCWRWDGYVASAAAPSRAASRLAERNRLAEVETVLVAARYKADECRLQASAARQQLMLQHQNVKDTAASAREARQHIERLRSERAASQKADADRAARVLAHRATLERLSADLREAKARQSEVFASRGTLPSTDETTLHKAREAAERARQLATDMDVVLRSLTREREQQTARREMIARDIGMWLARQKDAQAHAETLARRTHESASERQRLLERPNAIAERRRSLLSTLAEADAAASQASDKLHRAEAVHRETAIKARDTLSGLAGAREQLARSETRHEALQARCVEARRRIEEVLGRGPQGVPESESALEDLTAELDRLKRDRERLGAVNLRAEDELSQVQVSHDDLARERNDLTEAIRQLRLAIQTLNREGRDRLDAAFAVVNGHFERLFVTLFGGGEAHLALIESDDPLQAGLEITARPPGKKSQTLSLLSGGEQTLTALAMIFAVFLTNPAPICVLDEVDAPLDDANVERFCHLLRVMSRETDTRFLIVTHNPVTMSHMDRLYGVTMAERGISQLVSVDLEAAEQLREAV